MMAVRVSLSRVPTTICVMYNPCHNVTTQEFDHYFNQLDKNAIVCGDFNAHSPLWSHEDVSHSNFTGVSLAEILHNSASFNLLTPQGTKTYLDKYSAKTSTIDLVIGSGKYTVVDGVEVGNPIGSDHFPVFYSFDIHFNSPSFSFPMRWNLNKINWRQWQETLQSFLNKESSYSLSEISEALINTTKTFTDLYSPKLKYKSCKAYWSQECSRMVALRRKSRREFEKHPSPHTRNAYNRQCAKTKRFIKSQKKKAWLDFCSSLDCETPENVVWKIFKGIQGSNNFSFEYPLRVDNIILMDNSTIAKVFADQFFKIFNSPLPIKDQEYKQNVLSVHLQLDHKCGYNEDFNLGELKNSISDLNLKSSIGPDYIHNKFLYYFPEILQPLLLASMNQSWKDGILPTDFKESILVPIHKLHKDKHNVKSYRPISLLSCFSKLYEKMVYNRLYNHFEQNNLLPRSQCGFRRSHSCIDILIYLETFIQLALRKQKALIIVFFDIEKAFDSANHLNILFNLINRGIRGRMLKWIYEFLNSRSFRVRVGGEFSDLRSTNSGVPQGAILSPLLFTILLCDPPVMDDVHNLSFADDLSLFAIGNSVDEATEKIQRGVDKFNSWLTDLGLYVNSDKLAAMLFTRKKVGSPPLITLDMKPINFVSSHKFLGLTLDAPLLSWKNHIQNLITSCSRKTNVMRALTNTTWGANRRTLLSFYNSYIRSRIVYGIQVYSSACRTELSKLEVVQNSAARIITGVLKPTPIKSLQIESGLKSIFDIIQIIILKYFFQILRLPLNHISSHLLHNFWDNLVNINWKTLPHKAPFLVRSLRICETFEVEILKPKKRNPFFPPPYFHFSNFTEIDFSIIHANQMNNSIAMATFSLLKNVHYEGYVKIYTDGSKQLSGQVGAAMVVETFGIAFSWRLNSKHSIVAAELYAIYESLNWALQNVQGPIVIFTDSLSSIYLIRGKQNSYQLLVNKIKSKLYEMDRKRELKIQYIPAHKGLQGNELADILAKEACSYPDITPLELELEEELLGAKHTFLMRQSLDWHLDKYFIPMGRIVDNLQDWKFVSSGNRRLDVVMARLRSGWACLNETMFRFGRVDSPNCPHCTRESETINHVLFFCKNYEQERNLLKQSLLQLNLHLEHFGISDLLSGCKFPLKTQRLIFKHFYQFLLNIGKLYTM